MAKKLDLLLTIGVLVFVVYSSAAFIVDGFTKCVEPTNLNIMILSGACMFTMVISHWKTFYVESEETMWYQIKKEIKNYI